MEKKLKWQCVMVGAVIFMISGFLLSLWALDTGYTQMVYIGLAIIGIVCVSWWFWVMIVIKTIMNSTEKTSSSILSIRDELLKVKDIVRSVITGKKDK